MKILMVSWSWYPTGGDWTYIENLTKLYQSHGHEVIPFSTINEKNIDTPYNKYFITSPDYKFLNKNRNFLDGLNVIKKSIISNDALKNIELLIETNKIDIAHFHNIHHHITPAIVWKLKKRGIKILWTLHDYKIICPEHSFISNNKICERCIGGNFYNCITHKCKSNSLGPSVLASIEAYFYHSTNIYQEIDAYLCPSEFLFNKFKQFGFDKSKLHVSKLCYDIGKIDAFIENNNLNPPLLNKERYILFVGRIEYIKGVKTLIAAVKDTDVNLKILGSGDAIDELKAFIKDHQINNVEFLGFQNKESVLQYTLNAEFVVCPSEWYENFPFSIIESFLLSKPVIGSKLGGIPELVEDYETGLLFEAGDSDALHNCIMELWTNESLTKSLGENARAKAYNLVNFETHWTTLENIINHLIFN